MIRTGDATSAPVHEILSQFARTIVVMSGEPRRRGLTAVGVSPAQVWSAVGMPVVRASDSHL
jgi:hypothetical protein